MYIGVRFCCVFPFSFADLACFINRQKIFLQSVMQMSIDAGYFGIDSVRI